ncbi:hypothetical protein ACWC10_36830 [Streptomyces sp. NPDC001595]|uniref:hypothetical protein n=1 Tax=Streptomyces sp. NPDC001532 TaxID=3154520 RepID=UPI003316B1AA
MSSTKRDVDHTLAYPEPPASPLWHRDGEVKARPLTPAQQRRNRDPGEGQLMGTKHCAVDDWLDAIPAPGPRGTVTFDLVVRPADIDLFDEDASDTVVTCTSGDPRIVHELLTGIQPGDLLRATGILVQPPTSGEPTRLVVDALEVLDTALVPVLPDMVMDRYGDYVVIFDTDTDAVPVFTAHGQWADLADNPDAIATLIDIHERVNGGDA